MRGAIAMANGQIIYVAIPTAMAHPKADDHPERRAGAIRTWSNYGEQWPDPYTPEENEAAAEAQED
jgi:hypothetical protein